MGRGRPRKPVLVGETYGRLTVIQADIRVAHRAFASRCSCSCGNEKIVRDSALRSGGTQSCGCLQRERVAEHNRLRSSNA